MCMLAKYTGPVVKRFFPRDFPGGKPQLLPRPFWLPNDWGPQCDAAFGYSTSTSCRQVEQYTDCLGAWSLELKLSHYARTLVEFSSVVRFQAVVAAVMLSVIAAAWIERGVGHLGRAFVRKLNVALHVSSRTAAEAGPAAQELHEGSRYRRSSS